MGRWFKRRLYPHFDAEIGRSRSDYHRLIDFLKSPELVAKHAFAPFLRRTVTTVRWKKPKEPHRHGKRRVRKNKRRMICYASHLDSHIMSYYTHKLSRRYERILDRKDLSSHIIAYRSFNPKKSNIHFAGEIYRIIKDKRSCFALLFDVENFFDSLDHIILMNSWREITMGSSESRLPDDHYNIFRSLTSYAWIPERRLKILFPKFYAMPRQEMSGRQICSISTYKKEARIRWPNTHYVVFRHKTKNFSPRAGIPQGTPISALLSNIYMLDFDTKMHHVSKKYGATYRRYSDDILIICESEKNARVLEDILHQIIKDSNLSINNNKTERWFFEQKDADSNHTCTSIDVTETGFKTSPSSYKCKMQYLGICYDGKTITLRTSGFERYRIRLARAVAAWHTAKKRALKNKPSYTITKRRLFANYSALRTRKTQPHQSALHPTRDPRGNYVLYAQRAARILSREFDLCTNGIQSQIGDPMVRLDRAVKRSLKKRKRIS